jgi:transcription elongation factor GreB
MGNGHPDTHAASALSGRSLPTLHARRLAAALAAGRPRGAIIAACFRAGPGRRVEWRADVHEGRRFAVRAAVFAAASVASAPAATRQAWWRGMSKAFTKEPAHDPISRARNYITPGGLQRLRDELRFLLTRERPAVTQVVAWAASNGDRSENADYQYGKRRLRAIDRRIRFLTKRIDAAEVVDPEASRRGRASSQVFFGATVRYANAAGTERVVSIVGADEVDLDRNYISWLSPLARALMKAGPGDRVILHAPGGTAQLQILEVRYQRIAVEPFTEPPGAEATPEARPRTGGG